MENYPLLVIKARSECYSQTHTRVMKAFVDPNLKDRTLLLCTRDRKPASQGLDLTKCTIRTRLETHEYIPKPAAVEVLNPKPEP